MSGVAIEPQASLRPSADAGSARWMIGLLTVGYALNLLDRQIINILGELIKRDLHLADWQLGALSGISFALLYSVAALPIARLADRSNRVRIIGTAVIVWSFFTAASAGAANFVQLLLRSEEHTSELQSLMRISYAVFCLKK